MTPEKMEYKFSGGMTIRDHFAGLAMQIADERDTPVLVAKKELGLDRTVEYDAVIHWPKLIAKRAYIIADAMIAARKEQP